MRLAPLLVCSFLSILACSSQSEAALIGTHSLEGVVPESDLVLKVRITDRSKHMVQVLQSYRGKAPKALRVENLTGFYAGLKGSIDNGLSDYPADAIVFLRQHLGRYYLTRERTRYLEPHSSIAYLGPQGRVFRFQQTRNPGPPVLVEAYPSLSACETALAKLLPLPRTTSQIALKRAQTRLSGPDLDRLHAALGPYVSLYRRDPVRPDGSGERWHSCEKSEARPAGPIETAIERLSTLALLEVGEVRRHALDALLVLASTHGPHQERRERAEAALLELSKSLGTSILEELVLDELAAGDPLGSQGSAARLALAMGETFKAKAGQTAWAAAREGRAAHNLSWALFALGEAESAAKAWERMKIEWAQDRAKAALEPTAKSAPDSEHPLPEPQGR